MTQSGSARKLLDAGRQSALPPPDLATDAEADEFPETRPGRIAALRSAIAAGSYAVSPAALADKLIARMLKKSGGRGRQI